MIRWVALAVIAVAIGVGLALQRKEDEERAERRAEAAAHTKPVDAQPEPPPEPIEPGRARPDPVVSETYLAGEAKDDPSLYGGASRDQRINAELRAGMAMQLLCGDFGLWQTPDLKISARAIYKRAREPIRVNIEVDVGHNIEAGGRNYGRKLFYMVTMNAKNFPSTLRAFKQVSSDACPKIPEPEVDVPAPDMDMSSLGLP